MRIAVENVGRSSLFQGGVFCSIRLPIPFKYHTANCGMIFSRTGLELEAQGLALLFDTEDQVEATFIREEEETSW
jgi:hypothetical protein